MYLPSSAAADAAAVVVAALTSVAAYAVSSAWV